MTMGMNPFAALIDRPRFLPTRRASVKSQKERVSKEYGNPWNLTPGECAALRAVVKAGCNKDAGSDLGISDHTVEIHLNNARKKMGMKKRLLCLLEWDRYERGEIVGGRTC